MIQLLIEYQPDPPFNSGNPDTADSQVMAQGAANVDQLREQRYLEVKAMLDNNR